MPARKRKQVKETRAVYRAPRARRRPARKSSLKHIVLNWAEIESATEPILLSKNGEPVAVVVSYSDYLRLENVRKEQAAIPMEEIQKLADAIAANFDPEKIILFGSYAYGLPRRGSDVDLLVVMDTDKGVIDAALEIRLSLPLRSFGLDLIVRTPGEIERRLQMGDRFITEITTLGKVLHERKAEDALAATRVRAFVRRELDLPA